jgi:hypothetical protein
MRARLLVPALAVLALAGCEKPTPGVTVSSGTTSVHSEATTYCREGQSAAKSNCVEHLDRVSVVRVKAGERVGIDVAKTIAEDGWILVDTGANARSDVQDELHFSYTPDFSRSPVIHLEVRSLDRVAENATVTGVWTFQLVQK